MSIERPSDSRYGYGAVAAAERVLRQCDDTIGILATACAGLARFELQSDGVDIGDTAGEEYVELSRLIAVDGITEILKTATIIAYNQGFKDATAKHLRLEGEQ